MRIVAISRILDEADIVEAFVRHTACFVHHHVFMDNGSSDGTLEILANLHKEGLPLSIFQNKSVSFNETEFNTFLFKEAVKQHAAHWVVCLDADEFIDDRKAPGGFGTHLKRISTAQPGLECLKIPLTDYAYTRADDEQELIVPKRLRMRRQTSQNYKVCIKGSLTEKNVAVDNGSHDVLVNGQVIGNSLHENALTFAHYSERSSYQYLTKFTKGWAKVLAAGEAIRKRGTSHHYQGPFDLLRDRAQDLIRSEWFMHYKMESPDLVEDPIVYRGGDLRYTLINDELARALRSMTGYLEALADQHGRLIDACEPARKLVDQWNREHRRIL